jgi:hypothetical protein
MKRLISWFLDPKAVIFGLVLLHVMAMLVYEIRTEQMFAALQRQGVAPPEHWSMARNMVEPVLLLVASIGLVIDRLWGYVVALLSSGAIIFEVGYLGLRAVSGAFDIPMTSSEVYWRWFTMTSFGQPQYLFELGLAILIMLYATIILCRTLYRRRAHTPRGI